ncbi:MAG: hypothetical protein F4230_06850 [Holophagales bacterium]|nr:hypothetical protein [Holophagales bacterium]
MSASPPSIESSRTSTSSWKSCGCSSKRHARTEKRRPQTVPQRPPGWYRDPMAQNPDDEQANAISLPDVLPVLPLKDAVIFPYIILPLSISRDPSMLAVEDGVNVDRIILLAPQRDGSIEEPGE